MKRQCNKCDEIFKPIGKTQRVCDFCKMLARISRRKRKKHVFSRNVIDPEKLIALKKELDKMSYAESV